MQEREITPRVLVSRQGLTRAMTRRADGNLTEWLFDACKKMAERCSAPDVKARWLNLAAGWHAVMESQQTPAGQPTRQKKGREPTAT